MSMVKINLYEKKVLDKINRYVKNNLNKIDKNDMKLGNGLFNRQCHRNSTQMVIEGKEESVVMCLAYEQNCIYPYVHFINKTNNTYRDNTLGWYYENIDYYFVKELKSKEIKNIINIFMDYKDWLIKSNSNNILRRLFVRKIYDKIL